MTLEKYDRKAFALYQDAWSRFPERKATLITMCRVARLDISVSDNKKHTYEAYRKALNKIIKQWATESEVDDESK